MKLDEYKLVFAAVSLIGVLLIASPVISSILPLPKGEQFSVIYLLGPGHMTENYPSNIKTGQPYSVYVGVINNLGSSAYYVLHVKFRNQTDSRPDMETGTPSSLQSLYDYRFSIKDGENWEQLLTFSALNASISGNQSVIRQLMINGVKFDVNKPSLWSSNSSVFFYQLVFELWLYDVDSGLIQYNNRFVDLQLNLSDGA